MADRPLPRLAVGPVRGALGFDHMGVAILRRRPEDASGEQGLGLIAPESSLGHDLAQAFHHLGGLAVQDALGASVDEALGLGAPIGVQRVGSLPQVLQCVR